jgi:hypothetical protein
MTRVAGDVCSILPLGCSAGSLWSFSYLLEFGLYWIDTDHAAGSFSTSATGKTGETG